VVRNPEVDIVEGQLIVRLPLPETLLSLFYGVAVERNEVRLFLASASIGGGQPVPVDQLAPQARPIVERLGKMATFAIFPLVESKVRPGYKIVNAAFTNDELVIVATR
jgi:hypothetical protein